MESLKKAKRILSMIFLACMFTGCQNEQNVNVDSTKQNIQEEANLSDEAAKLTESSLTDETEQANQTESQEAKSSVTNQDIIEIKENVFATMCDDIYLNTTDYLGKTLKIEGIASETMDEAYDEMIYSVYRTSPGCCGNDGWSGFEYTYEGTMPEPDDWIEVIGVLESYELDGQEYLRIRANSVTVKEERGAEFVQQ